LLKNRRVIANSTHVFQQSENSIGASNPVLLRTKAENRNPSFAFRMKKGSCIDARKLETLPRRATCGVEVALFPCFPVPENCRERRCQAASSRPPQGSPCRAPSETCRSSQGEVACPGPGRLPAHSVLGRLADGHQPVRPDNCGSEPAPRSVGCARARTTRLSRRSRSVSLNEAKPMMRLRSARARG
jgi:hypothetical protein